MTEASFYVLLYVVYVVMVFYWRDILPYKDFEGSKEVEQELKTENAQMEERRFSGNLFMLVDKFFDLLIPCPEKEPKKYMRIFIISILFIGFLSWIMVETAIRMAHILHISDSIVALTVLAAGTSIPDLIS